MAKRKDAEDWLEWAQAKYDAAQERFAWSERSDSPTMDSYSTLIVVRTYEAELRVAHALTAERMWSNE